MSNPQGVPEKPWPKSSIPQPSDFNLVRYFALTCLVSFVVITRDLRVCKQLTCQLDNAGKISLIYEFASNL